MDLIIPVFNNELKCYFYHNLHPHVRKYWGLLLDVLICILLPIIQDQII